MTDTEMEEQNHDGSRRGVLLFRRPKIHGEMMLGSGGAEQGRWYWGKRCRYGDEVRE